MNTEQRKANWLISIVDKETALLRRLPPEHNINIPGCSFWRSLYALAGLVKAGYVPYGAMLIQVENACSHIFRANRKEVQYQFSRAFRVCKPKRFQP